MTPRAERNWRNGTVLPEDNIDTIVSVFYAEIPAEEERAALREALDEDRRRRREATARASATASRIHSPGLFLGRDDEIARLISVLVSSTAGATVLVLGGPGFGKTTLTQKVAEHPKIEQRFGARRWFIELETVSDASSMVGAIAAGIGMERTAPKRSVLNRLEEKPSLVVLDNLETPLHANRREVEALMCELAAVPALAMMTSLRGDQTIASVNWTEECRCHTLPDDISSRLFLRIARTIRQDDRDLPFLIKELSGIPLAIRLVATYASGKETLVRVRKDWEKWGAVIADEPADQLDARLYSLVASIELSVNSPRLREPGKRLFRILGQLPAGIALEDLDMLLGEGAIGAARDLRAVGLLSDHGERIDLLPPVRDVAQRRHPPTETEFQVWVLHYLAIARDDGKHVGKDGGDAAVTRLMPEIANIGATALASAAMSDGIDGALSVVDGLSRIRRYTGISADGVLQALSNRCVAIGNRRGQAVCEEWQTRLDLAACYRLVDLFGWSDLVNTRITARVPGQHDHFLINPYRPPVRRDYRVIAG